MTDNVRRFEPKAIAGRRDVSQPSPFAVMAEAFEGLTHLPERMDALERMLADLQVPSEKELLTIDDAAERYSLSRSKLYELIARGELPAIKIDSSTRIPVVEMRRWIAAKLSE